jgi:hypothetical protein
MSISDTRLLYHQRICNDIIRADGYPNFADGTNKASRSIASGIIDLLGCEIPEGTITGQTAGNRFEEVTREFLERSFGLLRHLRPGNWCYSTKFAISNFDQFEHLSSLEEIIQKNNELATAIGRDYIIKPDIVVGRWPVPDEEVNQYNLVVNSSDNVAKLTPLRKSNRHHPILHASISCKWTLRSDRGQNARTEALNLIRNRKGNLPHIAAVTAEPLPTRICSLALGTGDIDCVYHFALPELQEAIKKINNEDQMDVLEMLIRGRRLRDISDLPFDLAV